MSDKTIPPGRGGSMYEVTLLRKGADPRTATAADFTIVRIVAANSINAQIRAATNSMQPSHSTPAR